MAKGFILYFRIGSRRFLRAYMVPNFGEAWMLMNRRFPGAALTSFTILTTKKEVAHGT